MSFHRDQPVTLVVMGVCGCGKTTFGTKLAAQINATFIEGDELHPPGNIEKMSNGLALEDADRWPWLEAITQRCNRELALNHHVVVACSALKKTYRDQLRRIEGDIRFVHLKADRPTIDKRMADRTGHFMPADLVQSQFAALESTHEEMDVIELDVQQAFESQHQTVMDNLDYSTADLKAGPHIGLIGLGVMGGNLAANIIDKGYPLHACDIDPDLRQQFAAASSAPCFGSVQDLVTSLEKPRCVFLLIKAGDPVDQVLDHLLSVLDKQDVVIDLGNSHYEDTERRCLRASGRGIRFVGCGTSGGAEGARHGPALMPGGDKVTYALLQPFLAAIAAQYDGAPCVTRIGAGGAGHFVKMVHNGIEYADMQLIAESYQIMRDVLAMSADDIAQQFARWNQGPLESYLIEATANILSTREIDGTPLVDRILDRAGQKGTGGWTTRAALEYGAPATLITDAVFARVLSSMKPARVHYASRFPVTPTSTSIDREETLQELEAALYCAKVINYTQGFMLMRQASDSHCWNLNLAGIASIWRAGCIIRGRLLDDIVEAFEEDLMHGLLDAPVFADAVSTGHQSVRRIIGISVDRCIPTPAYSGAITFFDSIRNANSSANLIQAQRDYFGAHTFERTDQPEGRFFHAEWDTQ